MLKNNQTNYREVLRLITKCKDPLIVKIEVKEIYKGFRSDKTNFHNQLKLIKKEEVQATPIDTKLFYISRRDKDFNIITAYSEEETFSKEKNLQILDEHQDLQLAKALHKFEKHSKFKSIFVETSSRFMNEMNQYYDS